VELRPLRLGEHVEAEAENLDGQVTLLAFSPEGDSLRGRFRSAQDNLTLACRPSSSRFARPEFQNVQFDR
jgi:hypothetical protein